MRLEVKKYKPLTLGFTLIEMAMVITIAGIILSASAKVYSLYMQERHSRVTYDRMQKISDAMQDFYGSQGRYPCPADPVALNGEEDCSGFKTAYGKDTDYMGATQDRVYIGAVPYEALRIGMEDVDLYTNPPTSDVDEYASSDDVVNGSDAVDDWNRQITYVVTESLTNQATFKPEYATINVEDENGNSIVDPAAAWVLISHGEDGAGAYTRDGILFQSAGCLGDEAAADNCDLNPGAGEFTVVSGLHNMIRGANYFDDVIFFFQATSHGFWEEARNDPSGSHSLAGMDIYNTNAGNVGIGIKHPKQKLDIRYGGLLADKVVASQIFNQDGTKHLVIDNFIDNCDSGDNCPLNRGITGFDSSGNFVYNTSAFTTPATITINYGGCVADVTGACNASNYCATGYYPVGVNASGYIICGIP